MTFGANDFLEVAVFERLNELFAEVGGIRGVAAVPLDLSQGMATVPTAAFVNVIERNLDALARGAPPAGMESTKTWLGGDADEAWLDYRDVNRWFDSLERLRRI